MTEQNATPALPNAAPEPGTGILDPARIELEKLDPGFKTIDEWFELWTKEVVKGNTHALLSLLHWGLKFALPRNKSHLVIIHYLQVADGFNVRAKEPGEEHKDFTSFGDRFGTSNALKMLRKKAWEELCNHFFIVRDERIEWVVPLIQDGVIENLIWFFRAGDDLTSAPNLDPTPFQPDIEDSYSRKARVFLYSFLQFACVPVDAEGGILNPFRGNRFGIEREQQAEKARAVFVKMRPKLVKLMFEYRQLFLLKNHLLDVQTRRALKKLALAPTYTREKGPKTLQEAYGGYVVMNSSMDVSPRLVYGRSRAAAEILLLYPVLIQAQRKLGMEKRKVQQEFAERRRQREVEEARRQALAAQARLTELGVKKP